MEMERRGTAIGLLMLSLVALLLVSAVVAEDTLRLPSDDPLREWPYKCCNLVPCLESSPPKCSCRDVVDECDAACKMCEEVESGHVCLDFFVVPDSGPQPKACTGA